MEVLFFVEMEALKTLCPEMLDAETGALHAFDAARSQIHEVADKVYGITKKGTFSYILTVKDFKN